MKQLIRIVSGFLIFAIWLTAAANVQAGRSIPLNDAWRFRLADDVPMAETPAFDDAGWRELSVPHDWSIEGAFSPENPGRNAWLPGGIGWYRKTFTLPADAAGKHVDLEFGGIYRHAKIWVNGEFVGAQYDGFTPFYLDISAQVRAGERNTLAVRVDNSVQPNRRWYTGSGIYRKVALHVRDRLHIEHWGTAITTPAVTASEARVKIVTSVVNQRARASSFELKTEIIDAEGRTVTRASSAAARIGAGESADVEQEASVYSPRLWSIDQPTLYTAVTRIVERGQVVDEVETTFGIRTIDFDPGRGFSLNGKPMKLKGVCLHNDAGTLGTAISREIWKRRLTRLKAMGCNAVRTAHNPMDDDFMDLCDRIGILVMDEFVDKWDDETFANPYFHTEWRRNFEHVIRRDRNHPSVIIWSVGNENHEPGSPEQTRSLEEYCNFVRLLDPTRPVVSGMQRGIDKDPDEKVDAILDSTRHMDLIGMNYGLQWSERNAHRNPGKTFLATESYPYTTGSETERNAMLPYNQWLFVEEHDFNIGLFLWVGVAYLGEIPDKDAYTWPNTICWPSSILDTAGQRTPFSYLYESFWSENPMVRIAIYEQGADAKLRTKWDSPSIRETWNLEDGKAYDLVTYTNCETIELYINGRRIGTQKLSDFSNRIMNWRQIDFEPGEVKAVGYVAGKAVAEFALRTAGEPVGLALASDDVEARPGGIVHVDMQLRDREGNPVSHKDVPLRFEVTGGRIVGLDNGDLDATDDWRATETRETAGGRCVAILRAEAGARALKMTVTGKGLAPASITFPVGE